MTGSLKEEHLELEEMGEYEGEQTDSPGEHVQSDGATDSVAAVLRPEQNAFYALATSDAGATGAGDPVAEVQPDDILSDGSQPVSDNIEGGHSTSPAGDAPRKAADEGAGSKTSISHAVVPADDRAMAPADLLIAPIPRISIHAFCLSEATYKTLESIKGDRRLSKTQTKVDMGGVKAAVDLFSESPTPNLVIIEMEADADAMFNQLNALADVCDPGTKVVVVGNCNDIRIYRALIREGISEYLVTPFSPVQILEAISSLYADPEAAPAGRVVAFFGAKGGTGSSTIAHNIAWVLAHQFDEEATIVDLDLPFGTACLNYNEDPTQGVVDALVAPERMDDVLLDRLLIRHEPNLNIFCSPSSLDRNYDLAPHAFETVLDVVRKSVPNVIVDVPNVWTNWSKMVLLTADQIVIVATPDLASLRNAMNMFEIFKQARPNDPLPHLVLNKTGQAKKVEITEKDFSEALQKEPTVILPFDGDLFGTASNNGQMVCEIDKRGDMSGKLTELAQLITGREMRAKKKASLLDFLGRQSAPKREKRRA